MIDNGYIIQIGGDQMNRNRKLVIGLCLLYVLFMGILAVFYFLHEEKFKAMVAIAGVGCGLIPVLLALFFKLKFNMPLIISYLIFLFGSQYMGSIIGWYGNGWWDSFLHLLSGSLIAFAGGCIIRTLCPSRCC